MTSGNFPTAATDRADLRWWTKKPEDTNDLELAGAVVAYARHIEEAGSQKFREQMFQRHARMYGNAEILGLKPWEFTAWRAHETRLQMNVIASCVDTATAKIAANRPAPQFLTNGADFELRRKAPKLNKFGKGMLHQSRSYETGPTIFRDGCIFGTGISKVIGDKDEKTIGNERVFPWDILIEDRDGHKGKPRTLTQRAHIDKAVLIEAWPQHADAIVQASAKGDKGDASASDQVVVYESWHLKSGPKATDGRHVIVIDGATLYQEAWDRPTFPFAVFRWENPIAGWWGRGIAERLTGIQIEINKLLERVQRSMHLLGVTKIILQAGSGVPKAHLNNDIGAILTVNAGAQAPTVVPQQSVHPEIFAHLDRLYQRAFDEVGISQLAAQSRKPVGLDSGKALREFSDIESERFVVPGRAYEQWFMDVVALGLDEARAIPGFKVDVPDKNQKIEVKWTDVNLDRDAYVLQCFPESLLPQTPAGRSQQVSEWQKAGWITSERAMELADIPDLEEAGDIATAPLRAIRSRVAAMLDEDDYQAPESYDKLDVCVSYTLAVYLDEREKGCPEKKLDLLRRYMNEAAAMLQPPPATPPPGPQAPPPGAQMPPAPMAGPSGQPIMSGAPMPPAMPMAA